MVTDTSGRGGKVEDSFQMLILEIKLSDALEG